MSGPDIGSFTVSYGATTVESARIRLHEKLGALHAGTVDPMISADDYRYQAIDEYLTEIAPRRLKRAARRVRMARKRRRGWA